MSSHLHHDFILHHCHSIFCVLIVTVWINCNAVTDWNSYIKYRWQTWNYILSICALQRSCVGRDWTDKLPINTNKSPCVCCIKILSQPWRSDCEYVLFRGMWTVLSVRDVCFQPSYNICCTGAWPIWDFLNGYWYRFWRGNLHRLPIWQPI